jgi:hypothetical protein
MKFFKSLLPLAMLVSSVAFAQEQPIKLYPDGVPNSKPAPANYVEKVD